jgi:divalent metal cation (Fe/Co/Zn/Cd) transporter
MVVLLWPERSIFLTVFGVGLAWAAVLAEVKPWLQGTPIVWVALTAAILGALAAWWLSQHCRRLGVAT